MGLWEAWGPCSGTSGFITRGREREMREMLSTPGRYSGRCSLSPGRGLWPAGQSAAHGAETSQPLELWEKHFCCLRSLVILLWQPRLTRWILRVKGRRFAPWVAKWFGRYDDLSRVRHSGHARGLRGEASLDFSHSAFTLTCNQ